MAFAVSNHAESQRHFVGYEPANEEQRLFVEQIKYTLNNDHLFNPILGASWGDLEETRAEMAHYINNQKPDYLPPTRKGHYWSHRGWVQKLQCSDSPHFSKPVRTSITSRYGRRSNPFNGTSHVHAGIDFRGRIGTPVLASEKGIVSWVRRKGRYGKTVVISHKNGFTTLYAHLSGYTVKEGERVNKGQTIGYVGKTGRVTGPHLHFEVRCSKVPVNPIVYLEKKGKRALVSVLRRNWNRRKKYLGQNKYISRKARLLRQRQRASLERPSEMRSGAF